jgi:DNA-binding beta-propeller fold protein YncE
MIAAVVLTAVVLSGPENHGPRPSIVKTLAASDDVYARGAGATTLAGTGVPGFNGDGRSAVESELDAPAGISEDRSGDLFIADAGNCRVREVPATTGTSFGRPVHAGDIVTLTGGSCGGGRPDPSPSALAVDAAGDLFIAFGPDARVDELPARSTATFGVAMTAGKLAVIAGSGSPGYSGDGGLAPQSRLDDPTGLAVDAEGDVLISDTGNCRLRLVAAGGGSRFGVTVAVGHIYTVAGSGICGSAGDGGTALQAQLWDPGALAVDPAGDVLIADQGNRTIRELAAHSGTFFGVPLTVDHLGTIAGEGSYGPYLIDGLSAVGETAEINFPTAIALDANGNLYIADGDMHAIRFVASTATILLGVTTKPDDMYTAAGAMSTTVLHDKTTWIQTHMLDPTGITLSPAGRLIYSDSRADVIRELPADA